MNDLLKSAEHCVDEIFLLPAREKPLQFFIVMTQFIVEFLSLGWGEVKIEVMWN